MDNEEKVGRDEMGGKERGQTTQDQLGQERVWILPAMGRSHGGFEARGRGSQFNFFLKTEA